MIRLLLYALAILISAYILPGVHVNHYGYALLVALVLTLANAIVKPILIILTIPITISNPRPLPPGHQRLHHPAGRFLRTRLPSRRLLVGARHSASSSP